jgi:hypothetical protein
VQADEPVKGMDQKQILERLNTASEESTNDIPNSQMSAESLPVPRSASPLPDLLPEHLKSLLNEWYGEHGKSAQPPCANGYSLQRHPCKNNDAEFVHKDGQSMQARR